MGYDTDVTDDARYSNLQQRRRKRSEEESEVMQTGNANHCDEMSIIDTEVVGKTEAIEEHQGVKEVVESLATQNVETQVSVYEKKELAELRKENQTLRKEVAVLSKFYNQQNQPFER